MRIDINTLRQLINEATGNAYELLGVSPDASPFEIRKAWRRLALQYRQDRKNGDPWAFEKIKNVNLAKDALLSGQHEYQGFENRATQGPPAEKAPRGPGIPQKSKETYKVYAPWREKRAVVRVGGKVYGTGPQGVLATGEPTGFKGGDRARVGMTSTGKMGVSDAETGRTQEWDPIDQGCGDDDDMNEVRNLINSLVLEQIVSDAKRRI